ncbi:hypothetical protein [Bacillus nakamurai]|uniref:hypothetical protein n=1 Tax=Bacillus nakamurai TaxID=1793963 RepID=UPI001E472AC8|nr:hypothetical protein [Bacillus nakamurai]MCC9021795.1 hypothetical protein [Bacillus nakamurai]
MKTKVMVMIHTNTLEHNGVYEGFKYNELKLKETKGKRLYYTAIKNGLRMITVPKLMKLEEGKVFVSFGKIKYEIGSYEEVTA